MYNVAVRFSKAMVIPTFQVRLIIIFLFLFILTKFLFFLSLGDVGFMGKDDNCLDTLMVDKLKITRTQNQRGFFIARIHTANAQPPSARYFVSEGVDRGVALRK